MKEKVKIIILVLICLGILLGIALFVYMPRDVEFTLPEDVDRVSIIYDGDIYELDQAKSQKVCTFFEKLEFVSSEKTTQYAYGGGIVVSFYKTEEVLEEIYIYDMNTIMVSQEDSTIKL